MIRTLIVDDEPAAREGICAMLAGEPEIEIAGEAASGSDAVLAIERLVPDLVLLDVQLPDLDGFGVLARIQVSPAPAVIFLTAYDTHAVRAFEVRALDYVLKPFGPRRLREAIDRVREQIRMGRAAALGESVASLLGRPGEVPRAPLASEEPREGYLQRLAVKTGSRMYFVEVAAIDWIEAADDYACVHAGTQTHLVEQRMAVLETRLDPARFSRIHRSAIVNLSRVREYYPASHGDSHLILSDGTRLRVSRTRRAALLAHLG